MDSMDIDNPHETNGKMTNGLRLRLVSPGESGEGLPYAPENWPRRGDIWRWKTGKRVTNGGHFMDRYLYPPKCLRPAKGGILLKIDLKSKLAVERYIRTAFPNANVEEFFKSFSWRIPGKYNPSRNGNGPEHVLLPLLIGDSDEDPDTLSDGAACKAGNRNCPSLVASEENLSLATMPCEICCTEPNFCTECCCILCCEAVSLEHGGYNHIKCEAVVAEGYICGHIAHFNCALRAYLAGTFGGSIGLDAEYYCRRCDAKTDLIPVVKRFLRICETLDSHDEVERVLNLGICMLQGSQKASCKELLNSIESVTIKLKSGTNLEDIWNAEESVSWKGVSPDSDATDDRELKIQLDNPSNVPIPFDIQVKRQELDDQIFQVLEALRNAQEEEYRIAEDSLNAQKQHLNNLYDQLETEKSELQHHSSGTNANDLVTAVLKRLDQINKQVMKLKEMEEIGKGFGRTPKGILEEHFNLQLEG